MLSLEKLKMRWEIEALSKQPGLCSVLLRYGAMAAGRRQLTSRFRVIRVIREFGGSLLCNYKSIQHQPHD